MTDKSKIEEDIVLDTEIQEDAELDTKAIAEAKIAEMDDDKDDKKKAKDSDDDDDGDKDDKKKSKKSDDDDEENDDDVKESVVSYAEVAKTSVSTMVDGMEDLSEGFQEKAEIILEAAIAAEAKSIRESVEAEFQEKFDAVEETISEQVDEYLGYVVNEWIEENKVEVEKGLKVTLAESFLEDFKTLLTEHHVMIPDDKMDLFEEAQTKTTELEEQVNTLTEKLMESSKEILTFKQEKIIADLSEGLADTQVEKFTELLEGVEAPDEETFATKAKTLRESVFTKADKKASDEEITEDVKKEEDKSKASPMSAYMDSARKFNVGKTKT